MIDITHAPTVPEIRKIAVDDVKAALREGLADFRAAPAFGLFFGGAFSAIGIVIYLQLVVWGSGYWVVPFAAGFPLIGPFAAVGLYEVSRRRERGEPLDWGQILTIPLHDRARQIPPMAFVTVFFFLVWLYLAHLVFALSFARTPLTNVMTSTDLLFTTEGIMMLLAGSLVGGALALLLFAITVVSVPLLLDREIDVVTAMVVSVRSVLENRQSMLIWGAVVAVATVLAMLPMFLGMLIVFPVLGHASWHIYRRVVVGTPD